MSRTARRSRIGRSRRWNPARRSDAAASSILPHDGTSSTTCARLRRDFLVNAYVVLDYGHAGPSLPEARDDLQFSRRHATPLARTCQGEGRSHGPYLKLVPGGSVRVGRGARPRRLSASSVRARPAVHAKPLTRWRLRLLHEAVEGAAADSVTPATLVREGGEAEISAEPRVIRPRWPRRPARGTSGSRTP